MTCKRNRNVPSGYLLYAVAFDGHGQPTAPSNSIAAVVPLLSNADVTKCPNGCFRPVGLAWDSKGRLLMSSDFTGEVYIVGKEDGGAVDGKTLDGVPLATGTGGAGATSRASAAGSLWEFAYWEIFAVLIAGLGVVEALRL
jgi:hypothetical protein